MNILEYEEFCNLCESFSEDTKYFDDGEFSSTLERSLLFFIDSRPMRNLNSVRDYVYNFSNEKLDSIYKHVPDLRGKRVFTVGSSGDQVIKAIECGATDITLADANPLTRYYTELKIACIKNLTYDEFSRFFGSDYYFMDYYYYRKVSHDLSPEVQMYWDSILLEDTENLMLSRIFKDDCSDTLNLRRLHLAYRDEVEYNKLKAKLSEYDYDIKYYLADFTQFPQIAEGQYDFINLSNIKDYVNESVYEDIATQLASNNLSPSGAMELTYIWDSSLSYYSKNLFKEIFKDKTVQVIGVPRPSNYSKVIMLYNTNTPVME